jgi:hypothetical protein
MSMGSITITPPNHGDQFACAVKLTTDDRLFGAVDLGPAEARSLAIQLLTCVGAINQTYVNREMALGARH